MMITTSPQPTYGQFKNGVPYLRFGSGPRTLLFLLGGPGNTLPTGAAATRPMKTATLSGPMKGMKFIVPTRIAHARGSSSPIMRKKR